MEIAAPDLLYVHRSNGRDEELRYSLRSATNLPHGRVWIVGPRLPAWAAGVDFIPTTEAPRTAKWANILAALEVACDSNEVADRFIYANDDFFVLDPVGGVLPYHRGPLTEARGAGSYGQGFAATERVLRDLGMRSRLRNYEAHVPMLFDRKLLAATLARVTDRPRCLHYRTLYGNLRGVGGAQIADVKIYDPRESLPSGPYASTNPSSWSGKAGAEIRRRFPDPSPYEET